MFAYYIVQNLQGKRRLNEEWHLIASFEAKISLCPAEMYAGFSEPLGKATFLDICALVIIHMKTVTDLWAYIIWPPWNHINTYV